MKKEIAEAKRKIEMLTNHLLDSIDVDLLSDAQKIAYLKAIQPYIMPRLESIKQDTNVSVSDNLQWLLEADELDIEETIKHKIGIGKFGGGKGLA